MQYRSVGLITIKLQSDTVMQKSFSVLTDLGWCCMSSFLCHTYEITCVLGPFCVSVCVFVFLACYLSEQPALETAPVPAHYG